MNYKKQNFLLLQEFELYLQNMTSRLLALPSEGNFSIKWHSALGEITIVFDNEKTWRRFLERLNIFFPLIVDLEVIYLKIIKLYSNKKTYANVQQIWKYIKTIEQINQLPNT